MFEQQLAGLSMIKQVGVGWNRFKQVGAWSRFEQVGVFLEYFELFKIIFYNFLKIHTIYIFVVVVVLLINYKIMFKNI